MARARRVVVAAETEPEAYVAALREQMALADTILNALGYEGVHFEVVEADDCPDARAEALGA